jgi:hypothetical protein
MKNAIVILLVLVSMKSMADFSCATQIAKETVAMSVSPYWRNLTQNFMDQMNAVKPRGCSFGANKPEAGLEIFMDDIEFVVSYGKDEVLAHNGNYATDWKYPFDTIVMLPHSPDSYRHDDSEDDAKAFVNLYLKKGYMSIGVTTCSPKVALANLIAYAPFALNARCGENRFEGVDIEAVITNRVQEILKQEPK